MKMESLDRCNVCDSTEIRSVDAENRICTCLSCGYVFDSPRPAATEIGDYYSGPAKYDSWLSEESARDVLWKRRLGKLRRRSKGGTLLDVGAGIGQFLHHAKPFFTKVTGTEVSDSAARLARSKYGLDLVRGNLTSIEIGADGLYDNITMFHVLEHVPNPKKTIRACWRLLRERGVLVVAVPNDILSLSRRSKTRVKKLLWRIGVRRSGDPGALGLKKIALDGSLDEIHLSHFTPSVLQHLLENSGFRVLESSLDPYYVASGLKLLRCRCCYGIAACVQFILGRNIYETIWMVGEKVGHEARERTG